LLRAGHLRLLRQARLRGRAGVRSRLAQPLRGRVRQRVAQKHLTAAWGWLRRHRRRAAAALLALLALAALALVLLTRPGAPFGPIDLTWHRIQVNRDLYVGLDPSYPPFAEWTPERIEGIEADIAREIARRLDVEPQLLIMGYDGLYDALYTGYVDFVIAGLRPSAAHNE